MVQTDTIVKKDIGMLQQDKIGQNHYWDGTKDKIGQKQRRDGTRYKDLEQPVPGDGTEQKR